MIILLASKEDNCKKPFNENFASVPVEVFSHYCLHDSANATTRFQDPAVCVCFGRNVWLTACLLIFLFWLKSPISCWGPLPLNPDGSVNDVMDQQIRLACFWLWLVYPGKVLKSLHLHLFRGCESWAAGLMKLSFQVRDSNPLIYGRKLWYPTCNRAVTYHFEKNKMYGVSKKSLKTRKSQKNNSIFAHLAHIW